MHFHVGILFHFDVDMHKDIAGQIKDPNISGTINLYSELPCCQSCSNIILEFRRKFPNIKLNIYVE